MLLRNWRDGEVLQKKKEDKWPNLNSIVDMAAVTTVHVTLLAGPRAAERFNIISAMQPEQRLQSWN